MENERPVDISYRVSDQRGRSRLRKIESLTLAGLGLIIGGFGIILGAVGLVFHFSKSKDFNADPIFSGGLVIVGIFVSIVGGRQLLR